MTVGIRIILFYSELQKLCKRPISPEYLPFTLPGTSPLEMKVKPQGPSQDCRALCSLQSKPFSRRKEGPFPSHLETCSGAAGRGKLSKTAWKRYSAGFTASFRLSTDPSTTAGSAHHLPQFMHGKLKFKEDNFGHGGIIVPFFLPSLLLTFPHTNLTLCLWKAEWLQVQF